MLDYPSEPSEITRVFREGGNRVKTKEVEVLVEREAGVPCSEDR